MKKEEPIPMLPRWHIILGALFAISLYYIFPSIKVTGILLIFLSSFLIDFDHYAAAAIKLKEFRIGRILEYHRIKGIQSKEERKRGIRVKGDFHIFHTIEFHLLVLVIGLFFTPFLYVFIGMLFHSIVDLISIGYQDYLYRREFFFVKWLMLKVRPK